MKLCLFRLVMQLSKELHMPSDSYFSPPIMSANVGLMFAILEIWNSFILMKNAALNVIYQNNL